MTPPPDPSVVHPSVRTEGSTDALPVSPALGMVLDAAHMPRRSTLVTKRILLISLYAMVIAVAAAFIARLLTALIGVVTNFAFYGRWGTDLASPAGHHLGAWVIAVPVIGGLIVGVIARYGSQAIRGHGIPEAMEQVLLNESRIKPIITFLKPVASAIAIGTGGPFGAEGPIIATGGAMGSFLGQVLRVTAVERKALLAAGAAAGMAAVFGSPVSAVVLAVELLLFELRPRTLIPVTLAATTATGVRYALVGSAPIFPMHGIVEPGGAALACYIGLGALIGLVAVAVTWAVYAIEDAFEKLPVHWMWWPAIGGIAVGVVGYFAPLTLGVGYTNIEAIVDGQLSLAALLFLCGMKFVSWSIALGSGTSGGTLAPLFTIGGALGAAIGIGIAGFAPGLGIDPRIAGLVGMAAIFAGSSRAMLASVVFAFETTQQPFGLLPLLGGCGAAYLISCLTMRNTIMTEKIARRGVRVPSEYAADYLEQVTVGVACTRELVTLRTSQMLREVRDWLNSGSPESTHQGFPVIDADGKVVGVLTRRNLFNPHADPEAPIGGLIQRAPLVVREDHSLREAADHMVRANVGRVIVVGKQPPHALIGIITRGDLLAAHGRRLREASDAKRHLKVSRRGSD